MKLTYAQMLARGRENEARAAAAAAAAAAEGKARASSGEEEWDEPIQNGPTSAHTNQTLKEQSQTMRPSNTANTVRSSASGGPPFKEGQRREFEPKDQRFNGRRSKENREWRERRRSERDGQRLSSSNNK